MNSSLSKRLTPHDRHSATLDRWEDFKKPRHQLTQVVQSIAACHEHHYSHVERRNILLVRQVAISGEENVEATDRQAKQF